MRQSVFYFCIILVFTVFISSNWNRPTTSSLFTGHGNPAVLQKKYTDWKIHYESQQGARFTRLPFLSHKPSLPMSLVPNKGEVVLDLVNGTLKATVRSLDSRLHYTLWFLGRSAVSSDRRTSRLFKIGDLTKGHDEWSLLHTACYPLLNSH